MKQKTSYNPTANNQQNVKVKSGVKAGAFKLRGNLGTGFYNHNQTMARGLKVKTNVKAGKGGSGGTSGSGGTGGTRKVEP